MGAQLAASLAAITGNQHLNLARSSQAGGAVVDEDDGAGLDSALDSALRKIATRTEKGLRDAKDRNRRVVNLQDG